MNKDILYYMKQITDYRNGNAVAHKLIDILTIVVLGTMACAEGFVEIEQFAKAKKEWLESFLELPNGIPSHDTLSRVLKRINPAEFNQLFIAWTNAISEVIEKETIAIDGKTVRRSQARRHGKSPMHMVSAWADENNLVMGQIKVDEKSNEITAIPELIKMLEIKGCIVTIDAMGTQKEIVKDIIDAKSDYVLALKENQKSLHNDVKLYFDEEILVESKKELKEKEMYKKTFNKDHGRLETREYYMTSDVEWLPQLPDWEGLKSIGMVISTRTIDDKTSVEKRYFISSLEKDVEQFSKSVRAHWGVENKLHWVLDVDFREDENRSRKDNGAENLSIIRHIALNLMKQDKSKKASINVKRHLCAWDTDFLLKIIGIEVK